MLSKGRTLHQQSFEARESEGNLLKSLQLSDEALLAYLEDDDILGASEILSNRCITFQKLAKDTGKKEYSHLAKANMLSAVEMARESNNKDALAIPLFELAKAEEELGDIENAITHYKEAIKNIRIDPSAKEPNINNPAHDRPAFLAEIKVRLCLAEYKLAGKDNLNRVISALKELENTPDIDLITHKVWTSGGYMQLAELLSKDQPEEAKKYLNKAYEYITDEPRMASRKKQWEELQSKFS